MDKAQQRQIEPILLSQSIQLERGIFSYPGTKSPAINSIDLVIPARSRVGFVGSTGSGKTTTVDLIWGYSSHKMVCLGLMVSKLPGAIVINGSPLLAMYRR